MIVNGNIECRWMIEYTVLCKDFLMREGQVFPARAQRSVVPFRSEGWRESMRVEVSGTDLLGRQRFRVNWDRECRVFMGASQRLRRLVCSQGVLVLIDSARPFTGPYRG